MINEKARIYHTKNKDKADKNKIKIYNKKYRINNKQKISNWGKQYRLKNLERLNNYNKLYRQNNPNLIKERQRIYRENNLERLKECQKIYNENNKDRINEYARNYRKTHSEKIKVYFDKLKIENPFSLLISYCQSHDRSKNLESNLTIDYLNALLLIQNNKCYHCDHELKYGIGHKDLSQISIDRIDNNIGHTINNCVISCLFCNYAKNSSKLDCYQDFITVLKYGMYSDIMEKYENIKEYKRVITLTLKHTYAYDLKKINNPTKLLRVDLENLLEKQNHCCAITGIPFMNLDINKFPFQMSLDRMDSSKLHTLDNCHFVCMAIQFGKLDKSMDEIKRYIKEIRETSI